eukprot:TRINITY_DN10335_c0_g1_i1.p1 TRINITY_DN10335_c0_g1~~TRINITY_DN10335_c0_g1_i1.p1  ORF type:complete len:202 (-),score=34.85 TRINITY_DN10335_c0_g1_i1:123-728(-)
MELRAPVAMERGRGRQKVVKKAVLLLSAAALAAYALLPADRWENSSPLSALSAAVVADVRGSEAFVCGIAPASKQLRVLQPEDRTHRLPSPLRANPNEWPNMKDPAKRKLPRKPPFIAVSVLNKITRMNKEGIKETFQCWSRDSTIIPAMIGHTIAIHNGQNHVPLTISEGMVGFRLGDFAPTHTFTGHPKQAKITKFRGR